MSTWWTITIEGDVERRRGPALRLLDDPAVLAIRATRRAAEAAALSVRDCDGCGRIAVTFRAPGGRFCRNCLP